MPISCTCVQVMLQTLVEDRYRGRVMSVFALVWSLMFLSGFLLNTRRRAGWVRAGARGRRRDRACLRVAVAGARHCVEKCRGDAQAGMTRGAQAR